MKNLSKIFLIVAALCTVVMWMSNEKMAQTPTKQTWYFSPIPAIGVGPNGLATKKIDIKPYCCPTDAIEITSAAGATDNDLQWVKIPLSLPAGRIHSVTVCYSVNGSKSFISQTRLATMTAPSSASVVHDDGTDLKSTTATCYTSKVNNVAVNGTTTLSLRVAVAAKEAIRIGGISIDMTVN